MKWLRELLHGGELALLREELARTRQENRALLNALLESAGKSPVADMREAVPVRPKPNLSLHQQRRKAEQESMEKVIERITAQRGARNGSEGAA